MSEPDRRPLLSVRDLVVEYPGSRRARAFRAVDDVSFEVAAGETLGLVGESGSGKTTIARTIQGLLQPTSGTVEICGRRVTARTLSERRRLAAEVQTVFQDPFGSLNPGRSIGATVAEPLAVAQPDLSRRELAARVASELERVGLPAAVATRPPAGLSGGQRQRVAIARALIARPRLIICDEAVSALDLSVQAQILNLLADLQRELGTSYLFITHDLAVVRHIAHRTAVLQDGRLVDMLSGAASDPAGWSSYTRKLFEAAPIPDPVRQRERRAGHEPPTRGVTDLPRLAKPKA